MRVFRRNFPTCGIESGNGRREENSDRAADLTSEGDVEVGKSFDEARDAPSNRSVDGRIETQNIKVSDANRPIEVEGDGTVSEILEIENRIRCFLLNGTRETTKDGFVVSWWNVLILREEVTSEE